MAYNFPHPISLHANFTPHKSTQSLIYVLSFVCFSELLSTQHLKISLFESINTMMGISAQKLITIAVFCFVILALLQLPGAEAHRDHTNGHIGDVSTIQKDVEKLIGMVEKEGW